MIGQSIAHYEITAKLGEGGMGVVYRARDTKLNRDVAIKLLPEQLAVDAERMERFRREAQVLAQLNHTGIAGIYGVEEADASLALVMELAEGQTLEERLASGPLPLDDALPIAKQIAEAVEAAHEKGIIHRDLKPANIKVAADGQVKILDFGLAKALTPDSTTATSAPNDSPTLTMAATEAGLIMGTAAYMSPEQACAKPADRRCDIWSYGVVLWEMLTGRKLFAGETVSHILADVIRAEIDFAQLPDKTPPSVRRLLRRCLERNPKRRLRDIGEARVVIEGYLADPASELLEAPAALLPPTRSRIPTWVAGVLAAMLVLVIGIFTAFWPDRPDAETRLRKFAFAPESFPGHFPGGAISPDGNSIAYITDGEGQKLWVRSLDDETPRAIAELSDVAQPFSVPFWSPDSEFIAFADGGSLKKIPATGGSPVTLCPLPGTVYEGGAWNPDGSSIVFSSAGGAPRLLTVPAQGGLSQPLLDTEGASVGPAFLPLEASARAILYSSGSYANRQLKVKNLESGEVRVLADGAFPAYSPTGHILYQKSPAKAGLWAFPFSVETLEPTGEAFPISEEGGAPSVAADGTLAYVNVIPGTRHQLVWRDREGTKLSETGPAQLNINRIALSPDGLRVAVRALDEGNRDIWVHDFARGINTRLTFDPGIDSAPVWSPSGEHVTYRSERRGNADIFIQAADGSGEPTLLVGSELGETPDDWSRDGKYLAYRVYDPKTYFDLWYLVATDDGQGFEPVPFLQTAFSESNARFSPDGRFITYVSDESGSREVYVRPFPEGGGKWQVSSKGGIKPQWSQDGTELFYVEDFTLIAVPVSTTPNFTSGTAKKLFSDRNLWGSRQNYSVSPDGRKIVLVDELGDQPDTQTSIHVVQNWFEEFRDRQ